MGNQFLQKLQAKFPSLQPNEDIRQQLTSVEIVELVIFLEGEFGIQIPPFEYGSEMFSNLSMLEKYVDAKVKGPG